MTTGHPALIAHLETLIRERGRLPFSVYMDEVLYHPEYGYYSREHQSNPIGAGGDFYTSPDVDPAFGHLLAGLFKEMADRIDGFRLVEIGAGKGLLARHVLERHPFPYTIVERSPSMRRAQAEVLREFEVDWSETLPAGIRGCVFSNEFFDALPVRRFVKRAGRVREIYVAAGFAEVEDDPEFPIDLPLLADGALVDMSLEATDWVSRIGEAIDVGFHLAIDYGYLREEMFARRQGTLMCYQHHRADEDPYSSIGDKDITAHVNFSDLIDSGTAAGLERAGYVKQMDFLIDLGILDLMAPLAERGDAASVGRVQALKNLLLPPMMGERFRILLQSKGLPARLLPGFRGRAEVGANPAAGQGAS